MDLGLKDRRVLITGASSGIGKTAAKMFEKEGAKVIIHYNKNKDAALKLMAELGEIAKVVQADLSLEKDVERMFDELRGSGRIDAIVCNAGIWPEEYNGIVEMDYTRWKNTLQVDLDSVFLCCRAFLKQLLEFPGENGSIVIVGSTAAVFGEAGHADYSAAKAAIVYGLTRSLKNEIVIIQQQKQLSCMD
ncbi:MAG: SDR family NAD(P)-dependent oxidoreductase [Candidatus Hodarchaeales archaeon]